jgi:hypothetical protein
VSRCSAWGRARPARDHDPCEPACLTPDGEPKTRLGELSLSPRLRPLSFDLERTLRVFLAAVWVSCHLWAHVLRSSNLRLCCRPAMRPARPLCVCCVRGVSRGHPATSACCTPASDIPAAVVFLPIKSKVVVKRAVFTVYRYASPSALGVGRRRRSGVALSDL